MTVGAPQYLFGCKISCISGTIQRLCWVLQRWLSYIQIPSKKNNKTVTLKICRCTYTTLKFKLSKLIGWCFSQTRIRDVNNIQITHISCTYIHLFYIKENKGCNINSYRQSCHWKTTVSSMAARHCTMLDVIKTSTCSSKCLLGSCKYKTWRWNRNIYRKIFFLQLDVMSNKFRLIKIRRHMVKTSPAFQRSWSQAALESFCPLPQQPE